MKKKQLVDHGYGRLDSLISDLAVISQRKLEVDPLVPNVLIAPSWGPCSIVSQCLDELLEVLLTAEFQVTVRFHPMTLRHDPELPERLLAQYGSTGRFQFDPQINTTDSLLAADIMISEWSGAPLEYAFARERPVIFIDTPPKINNPSYATIDAPILELEIREKIGLVIPMNELSNLVNAVNDLLGSTGLWMDRIREAREKTIYNLNQSGGRGAQAILTILNENS